MDRNPGMHQRGDWVCRAVHYSRKPFGSLNPIHGPWTLFPFSTGMKFAPLTVYAWRIHVVITQRRSFEEEGMVILWTIRTGEEHLTTRYAQHIPNLRRQSREEVNDRDAQESRQETRELHTSSAFINPNPSPRQEM